MLILFAVMFHLFHIYDATYNLYLMYNCYAMGFVLVFERVLASQLGDSGMNGGGNALYAAVMIVVVVNLVIWQVFVHVADD